jgi:hypothetical protein
MKTSCLATALICVTTAAWSGSFDQPPSSIEKNLREWVDGLKDRYPQGVSFEEQSCERKGGGTECTVTVAGFLVSAKGTELPPRTTQIMIGEQSDGDLAVPLLGTIWTYDRALFDDQKKFDNLLNGVKKIDEQPVNKPRTLPGVAANFLLMHGKGFLNDPNLEFIYIVVTPR